MIIILGPTGAGKSVQAEALAARHSHLVWFALGELLRRSKNQTIDHDMQEGELVDDQVIDKILRQKLSELQPDQVPLLDGHPRRLSQAKSLQKTAAEFNRTVNKVINLLISRQSAEQRLRKRHRFDDTKAAIAEKFKVFEAETRPVIEYYRQAGLVVDISGEDELSAVTEQIEEAIKDAA